MLLLDLPPEVFARVVTHLVTGAGIIVAWKHRRVCRTFRRAIEFETLANQPIRAFLKTKEASARSILKQNAALYISYRLTVEKNAYTFLPRLMGKICNIVCAPLPANAYAARRQHARTLCRLLVKEGGSDVQHLLVVKSPELSSKFTHVIPKYTHTKPSNIVAAAAAIGSLAALRTALAGNLNRMFDTSPLFGCPLAAAAAHNHFPIVAAAVKHLEAQHPRKPVAYYEWHIGHAATAALDHGHAPIALLLLDVLHAYGLSVSRDAWEHWMARALRARDAALVHRVQALMHSSRRAAMNAFTEACAAGDVGAVRMFVHEGFVSVHSSWSYSHGLTPLQAAVASKKVDVVDAVLQLGADPNGGAMDDSQRRPLWMAVESNAEAVVQILLRYGADPMLVKEPWNAKTKAWKAARNRILFYLVTAETRRAEYVRAPEPVTWFAADAPDLVLPVEADEDTMVLD
ncbi:hypothetical protein C7974DRAFT_453282 [Boeremia exigua]|uniref:uncharacterized protein n=1 Tax=Boeremia exigua TaxID=749465 RepID=UPI001E8E67D1|nr:uncharacterized protein C7974DRAFT_453282 [Boeremia exigua]KAH6633739.1 hypothetical protein C7974DRAFT_453282 [Boeremia exigua]